MLESNIHGKPSRLVALAYGHLLADPTNFGTIENVGETFERHTQPPSDSAQFSLGHCIHADAAFLALRLAFVSSFLMAFRTASRAILPISCDT